MGQAQNLAMGRDGPGQPVKIREFVPGFLLLPLSQNKGTAGQGNIFVPRDVLSPGNPSI